MRTRFFFYQIIKNIFCGSLNYAYICAGLILKYLLMSEKIFGDYLLIKSNLISEALTMREIADEYLELFNKINSGNVAAMQENLCDISERLENSYVLIHSLYGKLIELVNKKL